LPAGDDPVQVGNASDQAVTQEANQQDEDDAQNQLPGRTEMQSGLQEVAQIKPDHRSDERTEQQRDEAVNRRRELVDAIEKAKAEADAAEAEEQTMRSLLARLEAAEKAREAAERLAALKDRLTKAETTRLEIEEIEAKLAVARIPVSAIGDLQDLEVEIARVRALEDAARPSVTINYDNAAGPPIAMDGVPMSDGEERRYDTQAQLSVPGIGTIVLRSNRPAQDDNKLEAVEAKRRNLRASMGVRDLTEARARQVQAQQLEAELRELKGRMSLLAPDGLQRLREEVASRSPVNVDALELKADPEETRSALAEAEERRKRAKLILREAEPQRASAEDAVVVSETELASLKADQAQSKRSWGRKRGAAPAKRS